ncbi:sigma-70 family RNA polymerase sigma factor [Nocardioides conyzicola]|uniref:RNA polymerase sigma factor SigF n=1 Tax=Nocardioides conyzicola TaxID=1651781 RepID=A0ABP8XW20_9ACTN
MTAMVTAAAAPERTRDERRSHTNELLTRARGADPVERARLLDEVVVENIPVATSIARRYRGRGVAADDLDQVACLALVRAARRFDPAQADDFLTFAVPTIQGEIKRYFRDHGWMVRPTRAVQEAQQLINQTAWRDDGRERTPAELAAELGIEQSVVESAFQAQGCFTPVSLDQPLESGDVESDRLVSPDSAAAYEAAEARVLLGRLTRQLKPRDRLILYLRYVEGLTQAEIGAELGVTQMQVSRLLARVLERLRQLATSQAA